jgi:sulfate transport system permease protein
MADKKFNPLPGFGLTMGYTVLYLSLIVLIPIGALFLRVTEAGSNSPAFVAKDFKEMPDFLGSIKEHPDQVSAFVWEKLPEATRQKIASGDLADEKIQQEFIQALNVIVTGPSIYDAKLFEASGLGEKSKWYVKHRSQNAWFNRSLLEDSFPRDIEKKTNWLTLWLGITSPRAMAAYRLTFGASLIAALANAIFGTLLAWVLARYEFPGRRLIDAMVDFPFALPTAVAGLTLANLFHDNGWLGQWLVPLGIRGAYSQLGVVIALTFVGMPFVVRTLQPVLENFERDVEEAAATLGAGRLRTFMSVIAPSLMPAILTGFALAFARAIGEYGSVVFISGNIRMKTEIAPYLIIERLEEFNYAGAMSLAVVLLVVSFALLIVINMLEQWAGKFSK